MRYVKATDTHIHDEMLRATEVWKQDLHTELVFRVKDAKCATGKL
jgi:hypothetical protein